MFQKAVVDRIVDTDKAVLLVGDHEIEYIIDTSQLPKGIMEGHWLKIQIQNQVIVKIELDEEETQIAKNRIKEKMEKLKEKSSSKFKKK